MKIKVALIGLGKVFYRTDKFEKFTHSFSLQKLKKNFKLNYAIDPVKKKRSIAENLFNCETSNNINILKNKKIDLLIISTPTSSHLSILIKILKFLSFPPKALLLEKPAAPTLSQSLKIRRICKKKGIIIFVNYFRDYDKNLSKIKKIFQYNSESNIDFSGNYQNNSSHFVSLFIKLFGKLQKVKLLKKKKTEKDLILDFNLYFKNNNMCIFKNKYYKKNYHHFSIKNKNNKLIYNNIDQTFLIKSYRNSSLHKLKLSQNFNNVYKNIQKFFNKKKYSLSSIENAIEVHKVFLKCKRK